MKGLAIILVMSLFIGSCVAFFCRRELVDFQAYMQESLQPNLKSYGRDIAP